MITFAIIAFIVLFCLNCFMFYELNKRELRQAVADEILRLRAGARAGGSGMVINKTTGKIENAVSSCELTRRANKLENISDNKVKLYAIWKVLVNSILCTTFLVAVVGISLKFISL